LTSTAPSGSAAIAVVAATAPPAHMAAPMIPITIMRARIPAVNPAARAAEIPPTPPQFKPEIPFKQAQTWV